MTVLAADIRPDSETLVIQYYTDGSFEPVNRNSSCIIGAFATAHARVQLHKCIDILHLHGCLIIYVDTDSIIFLKNKDLPNPLPNMHPTKMGCWKNELPDQQVLKGIFVGPKIIH